MAPEHILGWQHSVAMNGGRARILYVDFSKAATWKEEPGKKNSEQPSVEAQRVTLCPLLGFTNSVCVILLGTTILKVKKSMDRLAPLKTKALFERGHTHQGLFCFVLTRALNFKFLKSQWIMLAFRTRPHTPSTLLASSDHGFTTNLGGT